MASVASWRWRTVSALREGAFSQLRNRRAPIGVAVWFITANNVPAVLPSKRRSISRLRRVCSSITTTSTSDVLTSRSTNAKFWQRAAWA